MTRTISSVVLAAGMSQRWGPDNKLVAPIDGVPMVLRTVRMVLDARPRPVVVVTGHEAEAVSGLLSDLPVDVRHAADCASGLAASLKAGVAALPRDCDGALICLADMPFVRSATLDALADAFDPERCAAAVPVYRGEWGNPVLLGRALFSAVAALSGDRGARALLAADRARVLELAVDDPGVLRDVDRRDALVYPQADGID